MLLHSSAEQMDDDLVRFLDSGGRCTWHREIDIGDALRVHVEERLERGVSKYFADPIEAHVKFSREGEQFRTHVSVHVGKDLFAEGRADDAEIYASFNAAAEHVEKQLRRNKRKLRDHH